MGSQQQQQVALALVVGAGAGFALCRAVEHMVALHRRRAAVQHQKEARKMRKKRRKMKRKQVDESSDGDNTTSSDDGGEHASGAQRPITHVRVKAAKLNVADLVQMVQSPSAGAIVTFSGTTRNSFQGKTVTSLEYEAYESMAEKELRKVCDSVRSQWPDVINIAIEHKVGACPILDTSVIIAVSSGHRQAALDSAKYAINTLKERVPIWKKEVYEEPEQQPAVWKENKEFFACKH